MFDILKKMVKITSAVLDLVMNSFCFLRGNMPIYKFLGNIFFIKIFLIYFINTKFSDCHTGYWAV